MPGAPAQAAPSQHYRCPPIRQAPSPPWLLLPTFEQCPRAQGCPVGCQVRQAGRRNSGLIPGPASGPAVSATHQARRTSLTARRAVCVIPFYPPLTVRRANGKGPRTNHPAPLAPITSAVDCFDTCPSGYIKSFRCNSLFKRKKAPFLRAPRRLCDLVTLRLYGPATRKTPFRGPSRFAFSLLSYRPSISSLSRMKMADQGSNRSTFLSSHVPVANSPVSEGPDRSNSPWSLPYVFGAILSASFT